jgi:signal transduction histidine kinase
MNLQRFGLIGFAVLTFAALLDIGAYYTAERSFAELRDAAMGVRQAQVAQNLIGHLYRRMVDAETGQRGYLLTRDATYLGPYANARAEVPKELSELSGLIQGNSVQVGQMGTVSGLVATLFSQMEDSLAMKRDRGDDAVRDYMLTHQGMVTMDTLRLALDGMTAEEQTQFDHRFRVFAENQDQIRAGSLVLAGLNVFLVTVGAIFLSHEARRRRNEAAEAAMRNEQLAQAVRERTAELTELSHYLQRLQEEEKAKIAREIHDELGGTLAAAKIDLQLLSDKLPREDPQQSRIARIVAAIDTAVQVKRRIIENLRPTILDSLGIGAALRWQCSEYRKRMGVPCRVELTDENLRLSAPYSITMYRVVQEALTNVSKYAEAKNVAVSLQRDGELWVLRVADDGIGIDTSRPHNATAHGLLSMRERARALGGEFSIRGQSGRGTVVEIRVPIEKALTA